MSPCRILLAAPFLLIALARHADGQAQTLLSADFESGLGGWSVQTSPLYTVPWHVAANGECGAVTAMAACNNGPAACDYVIAAGPDVKYLRLHSPWFSLDGAGPWTFEFDYRKSADVGGDVATLWIEASGSDGIFSWVAMDLPDSGGLQHVSVTKTFSSFWIDKAVRLEFELQSDATGNLGFGLMVDNVVVTNAGGWLSYDVGKPGSAGTPVLTGSGTLTPGSANELGLAHAQPASTAMLVFGLQHLGAPFKGGTMLPKPLTLIALPTDAAGNARLPFVLPPGLTQGSNLYFQCWIQDAGASFGLAASNALVGSTG